MSICAAGKKQKISEATLRHKLSGYRGMESKAGPRPLLTDAEEQVLTIKTKAEKWKIKAPKLLRHYNNYSSQPHQSQSYTTSSIRARATATCIIKTTATSSIRARATTTSSIRAKDTTTCITGTFFTKTRPQ
ncbi:hypothetical protein Pcinc_029714 [Petrolisthes cinctipes]|uniref:Uncharacterized protein n=1 Tax=Petrolisthes cinctipes TaxID=88211 RepID=A0AAE1F0A8_PETCI|nr:hypothetical protein Pcinc_029714 [Petrolisthes cinctipes]